MTTDQLLRAVSAANPTDLEHSERTVRRKSRLARRILLAAAALAVLTASVFALTIAQSNGLRGAKARQTHISKIYAEPGQASDLHESWVDVYLDLIPRDGAPQTIETYYVPTLAADQWETVPLEVGPGQKPTFSQDTLLQWKDPAGNRVVFTQRTISEHVRGTAMDSVCTGYDAAWHFEQIDLAGRTLQRLTVEPSASEEAGVRAENPGLRKLYWSDGDYLFTLEVGYTMTDQELTALLESVAPVEDVTLFFTVRELPAPGTSVPRLELEAVLFPTTLPEGCVQIHGSRQSNGGYLFIWLTAQSEQDPNVLALTVEPAGENNQLRIDWETAAAPYEKQETVVNGLAVTCYQGEKRAELLWTHDGADYSLRASGAEALSVQTLLELLQSFAPTDAVSAYFLQQ